MNASKKNREIAVDSVASGCFRPEQQPLPVAVGQAGGTFRADQLRVERPKRPAVRRWES